MSQAKFEKTVLAIENCVPPWGEELGKLVSLDRLIYDRSTIHHNGIDRPDFELSALEATLYLHRLHTLSWAIVLFWKPKNFSIYAPNGHRDTYKPLGALYAACMDLCEKLHSFETSKCYANAAEWFRLIVEEQIIEGFSTGQGKTQDISLIQQQNSALSEDTCPFEQPHIKRLIELAIAYQACGRIDQSYRKFVSARKKWTTACKSKIWHSLIDNKQTIALAPPGRQKPKSIPPLIFNGSKTLWESLFRH